MPEQVDALALGDGRRLAIVADDAGLLALPMVCDADGRWRGAAAGDGVAEALLDVLARNPGLTTRGPFTIQSWTGRAALGERAIGVDQTNESVIVGDAAVVKWATHLQEGPHPAPRRVRVLRDAGFDGMPIPWGFVTWRSADGVETMAAYVDEYLSGAVDGWTWAVDLITVAAIDGDVARVADAAARVGTLVADLHAVLRTTATVASAQDAQRWRDAAFHLLDDACALHDVAREHRGEIARVVDALGTLADSPVIEGHGDLHVGQVLLCDGMFFVTDFDGNPILPAAERILPIPAAQDVAGMAQSLAHAAIVARKHTDLDSAVVAEVDAAAQKAFLAAYELRVPGNLYDPGPVRAFRMQQVLREIVYAARHLPRWMYVPDAALPALLDEGGAGVKPDGFAADLYRKPEVLGRLSAMLADGNPWADVVPTDTERVVLLGMGSSAYAGGVAAARMRARGLVASSELASSQLLPDWGEGTLVVATSASGGSAETLDALERLPLGVHTVALTNASGSAIAKRCRSVVELAADPEVGGVACRSYQHTLALLLALECHLMRTDTAELANAVALSADASAYLLDTESDWRLEVSEPLLGPSGVYLAGPAERFCNAQQGALMLREGPRLPAVGCETGDWSHVDVYLTKTLDYRLLVFAGSQWEAQMAEWTTERGSTVVGVGGVVPGTQYNLRYPGDGDDTVRLLTEVLVPELMAARAWQAQRR